MLGVWRDCIADGEVADVRLVWKRVYTIPSNPYTAGCYRWVYKEVAYG